jgi:hypothetical protein
MPIKKVSAIFLITLLVFNSFGLFFFYWGNIEFCKIKAHDFAQNFYQVPEKAITIFSSKVDNFKLKEDEEIIANGNLFDIVKREIVGNDTLYYALCDHDEDLYSQKLSDWNRSNANSKSTPAKAGWPHIEKYLEVLKLVPPVFSYTLNSNSLAKLSNHLFYYQSPLIIVFSPPPDFLFS